MIIRVIWSLKLIIRIICSILMIITTIWIILVIIRIQRRNTKRYSRSINGDKALHSKQPLSLKWLRPYVLADGGAAVLG